MSRYSLTSLSDRKVSEGLTALNSRDRLTTAELLAFIAEFDERKLYLPVPYSSMHAYCVRELRMSEDIASKRIQAARAARKFPPLFDALADGRLHLTGLSLLAPHVTDETGAELLAAATHKTRDEIEQLLADRHPRPDLQERVFAMATTSAVAQHAPGHVDPPIQAAGASELELNPEPAPTSPEPPPQTPGPAPAPAVQARAERGRGGPLGTERYGIQFTASSVMREKLRRAQELLGSQARPGDLARVFERALEALIEQLERRKFAATQRPRKPRPGASGNARRIPAHVKRAVRERDGDRCTFAGPTGQRCEARARLEYDHIVPVACGGLSTPENLRLRCRGHNQFTAEQDFGRDFMRAKRGKTRPSPGSFDGDVVRCLIRMGRSAEEAQQAASHSAVSSNAPLERKVQAALACLGTAPIAT